MRTIDHDKARHMLLGDERSPAVEEHLASCPACSRFASDLDRITAAAPQVGAGDVPADLADRVLARVAAEDAADGPGGGGPAGGTAAGTGVAVPLRRRRPGDGTVWAAMRRPVAAAAAVLLILGVLALAGGQDDEPDPRQVLLAAATATEEAGAATVEVEGHSEVTVEVHTEAGHAPDLSQVPPELYGHIERGWAEAMTTFEADLREFEAEVNATLGAGSAQIDQALIDMQQYLDEALRGAFEGFGGEFSFDFDGSFGGGFGNEPPPPGEPQPAPEPAPGPEGPQGPMFSFPPPPPPQLPVIPTLPETSLVPSDRDPDPQPPSPQPTPPTPPSSVSTRVVLSATGALDAGDAVRLSGTVGVDGRAEATVPVEAVAAAGSTVVRAGTTWRAAGDGQGPVSRLLLRADGVSQVLRSSQGGVERDETERMDGEEVRRYRFAVDPVSLGLDPTLRWRAEAWIDGDDRVRQLRIVSAGSFDDAGSARWRTDLRLRLRAYGQATVDATLPEAAGTVEATAGAPLVHQAFGAEARAGLAVRAE